MFKLLRVIQELQVRRLGIERKTLYKKAERLGIDLSAADPK